MPSKYPNTATYWAPSTLNEYGEQSFIAPTQISVRWQSKLELIIDRETGKEIISKAIIYLNQDVTENGFLYLGVSSESNPKSEDASFLIRRVDKTPNLKGTKYTRKVWL